MKKVLILLFYILLLFTNCSIRNSHDKIVYIDEFPKTISLSGKSIEQISNDFFPFFMSLNDSLLFFCDTENDPHFYVYQVPDFKFITSFGMQGHGPGDIHDPVFWDQFIKNDGKTKDVWIYEMNLMKMISFDIDKALESSIIVKKKSVVMPPEIDDAVNILALNDSIFIGGGGNSSGEFFIYNSYNKSFEWRQFNSDNDEDFMNKLMEAGLLREYKRGTIKIRPDRTRFVKSYIYSPTIDVYDTDMNITHSIVYSSYNRPKINSKTGLFDVDTEIYFINIFLTDKYIYALNLNCNLSNFDKSNCNNIKIDVFSWDGQPVCQYDLHEGIIATGAFVVDETNRHIYTINPKSEFDYYSSFDMGN